MKSCVYPGSFDPPTNGHIDIIERACGIFPKVYVAVLDNALKKYTFEKKRRIDMLQTATAKWDCVEVVGWDGLLVNLLRELDTRIVLRGLRTSADLELEQQLAIVNGNLLPGVETFVLLSRPHMQYVSSSIVRELIQYGADISEYVPGEILELVRGGIAHEGP